MTTRAQRRWLQVSVNHQAAAGTASEFRTRALTSLLDTLIQVSSIEVASVSPYNIKSNFTNIRNGIGPTIHSLEKVNALKALVV